MALRSRGSAIVGAAVPADGVAGNAREAVSESLLTATRVDVGPLLLAGRSV